MKRRKFIRITAAGAFAVGLPAVAVTRESGSDLPVLADTDLARILGDDGQVREIGKAYRDSVPEENDATRLADEIRRAAQPSRHGRLASSRYAQEQVLRDRLQDRIRADFASGDVVRLRGWVLSRTEARQSALFSLLTA